MGIFSLLALLLIVYLCAKAVGSIWRDAFGTLGGNSSKRTESRTKRQTTAKKPKEESQKPIQKGEGEYVDYEEV